MKFIRYRYQVGPEYDFPEFRVELEQIALDKSCISASLKEDTAASVWRSEIDSRPFVVKRYNTQGVWHAIRRSFRQSRADNCREMTTLFTRAGIPTAANVAVIQEWLGPFKLRSWFICEFVPGEMLHDYLAEKSGRQPLESDLATLRTNVIELFEAFRLHHLSHGDLKASNILLSEDRLCLIDLDAARAHKNNRVFQRAHIKDQSRFMKNWLQQPEIHHMFEPLITSNTPKSTTQAQNV